jgi:hypothetical protein
MKHISHEDLFDEPVDDAPWLVVLSRYSIRSRFIFKSFSETATNIGTGRWLMDKAESDLSVIWPQSELWASSLSSSNANLNQVHTQHISLHRTDKVVIHQMALVLIACQLPMGHKYRISPSIICNDHSLDSRTSDQSELDRPVHASYSRIHQSRETGLSGRWNFVPSSKGEERNTSCSLRHNVTHHLHWSSNSADFNPTEWMWGNAERWSSRKQCTLLRSFTSKCIGLSLSSRWNESRRWLFTYMSPKDQL